MTIETEEEEKKIVEIFKIHVENPFYNWEQLAWIYSFVVNFILSQFNIVIDVGSQ